MAQTKIYAPNGAYTGAVGGVVFVNGVADVDLADYPKERAYLEAQGYGIGAKPTVVNPVLPYDKMEPTDAQGNVVDARDYGEKQRFGAPLRDAAVDPRPTDYLPPTNAGEANPHGPKVVAPEIRDSGPAGIRAGEVFVDDVKRQAQLETERATAVLVDGELATDQAVPFVGTPEAGNMGPLGLSDPGSVDLGLAGAVEVRATEEAAAAAAPPPAKPKPARSKTSTRRGSRRSSVKEKSS